MTIPPRPARPGLRKSPSGRFSTKSPSGPSPADWFDAGSKAVTALTDIIRTVCEERRKTRELDGKHMEALAGIEAEIRHDEEETARFLGQCEADIARIREETKRIELQARIDGAKSDQMHEERMLQLNNSHEVMMKQFDILGKVVERALKLYDLYCGYADAPDMPHRPIDLDALDRMNDTIRNIQLVIATGMPPQIEQDG